MNNIAGPPSIVSEAKLFADKHIRPYATQFEEDNGIPRSLIEKMGQNGFLGAILPSAYGGLGLDPIAYGQMTEEIGKACCSTRSVLTVHTSLVGETILRFGTEEQKSYWLPLIASGEKIGAFALSEPGTGSDAAGVKTSYSFEKDEYVITGRKKWISLGNIADFFIVIASCKEKITAFIVERDEMVKSTPMRGMLGNKAAHIAEIEFNGAKVPAANVLGKEGIGLTHIINAAMDYGRYSIAWAGLAIAQEALDSMATYARRRSQFGQKIYKFQLIQQMISDAVVNVHAARSLCIKAGQMRIDHHRDAVVETIIAKYYTSKTAMQVATDAVQLHGGNGCYNQYVPERLFREAKILEIIEGSSQVLQGIISDFGLRKYHTTSHD